MGIAAEEGVVARQQHLSERLRDARAPLLVGRAETVSGQRLLELRLEPERRVQRGGRILGNVRDELAAQLLTLEGGKDEDVAALDPDFASRDPRPATRVSEYGEADRRLARTRFPDEPQDLAGGDLKRDAVDDVLVAPVVDLDTKVDDLERGDARADLVRDGHMRARHGAHFSPPVRPRSIPIAARARPSPTRLVPIVSRAMAITGSRTGHGCSVSPFWFSLIIRPQSAAGGCSPKPRKLSPATTATLNDMRSVVSAMRGLETLGSSSERMIFRRGMPIASAARTKSRSTISTAAPRVIRAARGIVETPTARTSSHSLGPTVAASRSARTIAGSDRKMSIVRMSRSSSLPCEYAASRPMVMPSAMPSAVDRPESTRTDSPPYRSRLRTSRPRLSVPSQASLDGGANGSWPSTPWSGAYGATRRPKVAIPMSKSVMPSPIFVRCCFQAAEKRTRSGPRRGSSSARSSGASATVMSVTGGTSSGAG